MRSTVRSESEAAVGATRWAAAMPPSKVASGDVLHHAVQRGVGLRHLGFLVGAETDGLSERIDRHPVIGRGPETPLGARGPRVLGESGNRQETEEECSHNRPTHNEWLRRGHSLYA